MAVAARAAAHAGLSSAQHGLSDEARDAIESADVLNMKVRESLVRMHHT